MVKIGSDEDVRQLIDIVMGLSSLKFFPQNEQAIRAIAQRVADTVSSMEHARWLVERMCEKFDEWPGPVSLRETYLDRFPPIDGDPKPQIQARPKLYLPAGVSYDPDATYGPWPKELMFKPKIPVRRIPKEVPLLVPGKDFKPITAEDIEEARRARQKEKTNNEQSQ